MPSFYSNKVLAFVVIVTLASCATTKIPPILTYEEAKKQVDALGDQLSPTIEIREGFSPGAKPESVTTGTEFTVPASSTDASKTFRLEKPGLLIDESTIKYLTAIHGERDRRRQELESAYRSAEIKKRIYESTIEHFKAREASRGTWWEQNKGIVGLALGTTIGMAIVVGILYAVTGGKSISVNTQATVLNR